MTDAMYDRIRDAVSSAGDADETLLSLLLVPCTEGLLHRLRPEVDPEEDCPETFALAAAWLILEGMNLQEEGEFPLSFTAGSVTLHRDLSGKRTQAAYDLLAPWCQDPSFAVREVMG